MAHSPIRPAYGNTTPFRGPLVPHDHWDPELWTGLLHFRWKIPREHPVAIGAGWKRIEGGNGFTPQSKIAGRRVPTATSPQGEVVAEIVRRGGGRPTPVLPGSSLNGAVRQVFELLTPSCRRGLQEKDELCQVKADQAYGMVCPACSLFGTLGYAGRLAFGEAVPEKKTPPMKRSVPNAWHPQKPVEEHVRIYDLSPDRDNKTKKLRKTHESTRAVAGTFGSKARVVNASDEELGILLLAMGLNSPSSPGLRLGGKKFHGLGAVTPELVFADEYYPEYRRFENEHVERWAEPLLEAALEDDERRRVWEELHNVISREA